MKVKLRKAVSFRKNMKTDKEKFSAYKPHVGIQYRPFCQKR